MRCVRLASGVESGPPSPDDTGDSGGCLCSESPTTHGDLSFSHVMDSELLAMAFGLGRVFYTLTKHV